MTISALWQDVRPDLVPNCHSNDIPERFYFENVKFEEKSPDNNFVCLR